MREVVVLRKASQNIRRNLTSVLSRMRFQTVVLIVAVAVVFVVVVIEVWSNQSQWEWSSTLSHRMKGLRLPEALNLTFSTAIPKDLKNSDKYVYATGQVLLPPKAAIDNFSYEQAEELFHTYVDNLQIFCPRMARLGLAGDGGWEVCEDDLYRPQKPCLVYSFGINNDWSFDDDVAERYGCKVYSFDPSMNVGNHQHSPSVSFYATGLSEYNGTSSMGWRMRTLTAIMAELGHLKTPIDILKVDIEVMELSVLPEMIASGALAHVRQFLFELHIAISKVEPSRESYIYGLKLLKDLYDCGFRSYFTHRNHYCSFQSQFRRERIGCNEIYLIRVS